MRMKMNAERRGRGMREAIPHAGLSKAPSGTSRDLITPRLPKTRLEKDGCKRRRAAQRHDHAKPHACKYWNPQPPHPAQHMLRQRAESTHTGPLCCANQDTRTFDTADRPGLCMRPGHGQPLPSPETDSTQRLRIECTPKTKPMRPCIR